MRRLRDIKFGFVAGELSPRVLMRGDLNKYRFGVKEAYNFFADPLGGASTRPGTEFCVPIHDRNEPVRIASFSFDETDENNYVVLFTKERIQFIQDGNYLLEAPLAASLSGNTVTTVPTHPWAVNDLLYIGGRFAYVTIVNDAHTVAIMPLVAGPFDPVTEVQKVYDVPHTIDPQDFDKLQFSQDHDALYIMGTAPLKLQRNGILSWSLKYLDRESITSASLSVINITASTTGSAGVAYCVTWVGSDGIERAPVFSNFELKTGIVNMTVTAGSYKVKWIPEPQAIYYNIYRTPVNFNGDDTTFGQRFGFVGSTWDTEFVDENVVPDFTKSFPTLLNPFASGTAQNIKIDAGGSGLPRASGIFASFSNIFDLETLPVVDKNGTVTHVRIIYPGWSGSDPSTATLGGGTTPANLTAVLRSGNFAPACSIGFQQRRIYAGSPSEPNTLWGSTIGQPDRFILRGDVEDPQEPFSLRLHSNYGSSIRFLQETTNGIFAFTPTGVIQIYGRDYGALTAKSAQSRVQTDIGCGEVEPLKLGRTHLYCTATYRRVMAIEPTNLPNYFSTRDISLLSDHLFSGDTRIIRWAWVEQPHQQLWAVLKTGSLLCCTYVPDQEIVAWTRHGSDGLFQDVTQIKEQKFDRVYFVVKRKHGLFIERFARRYSDAFENAVAVDSAKIDGPETRNGTLTPSVFSGTNVSIQYFPASALTGADVGSYLRFGDAKAKILSVGATSVQVDYIRPLTKTWPDLRRPLTINKWTIAKEKTIVSGLWHLNDEVVDVLADGIAYTNFTVTSGQITLPSAASNIIVGKPFTAKLTTLPVVVDGAVLQARNKRVFAITTRLWNSREVGVEGNSRTYLIDSRRPRTAPAKDVGITGLIETSINDQLGESFDGEVTFTKEGPAPSTILGYVLEYEVDAN